MLPLPLFIPIIFIATTFATVFFIYKASYNSKAVLVVSVVWLLLQCIISLNGFYQNTAVIPPRFLFLAGPALILIIILFITGKGRLFIDSLDIKTLTWLHVVRIPVEIVLFFLCGQKAVPQLMTFEGRNFDILSGLSAIIIALIAFPANKPKKALLLIWNFICLALLLNIVITAVLSAPVPFQKFAFDQPNIAILYFPFVWLPCYIVPVVLFLSFRSNKKINEVIVPNMYPITSQVHFC